MAIFQAYSGTIIAIDDFWTENVEKVGCNKLMSVTGRDGSMVNFVVRPCTYFVDHVTVKVGDTVTGFFDASAPVPLIFPPQLQAIVMTRNTQNQNVKVDYFNRQLVSSDGMLKLNIASSTKIVLENNQSFTGNLENRNLIVIYGATTKSIPAQTTPYKIIVMCTEV
ncbi:hypothetical protein [Clostridium amazonitimonense]|uniref:hypothetical protein n=1 Tax=Clostridium amazonitimonense TaxID=1499689 RepID=UPI000509AD33|nr:hypothetical protein [Clostridium amazonitimonense]